MTTPGPWFIEDHGIMNATRSRTICYFGDSEQDDADLELVASAPTLRSIIDAVAELHRKSEDTVEIEVFHEKGDPACDDRDVRYGDCVGHMRHIHVCDQCGAGTDEYGELAWFEWPCATAKAMGLA